MLIIPKALTTFINILHNPANLDKKKKEKRKKKNSNQL